MVCYDIFLSENAPLLQINLLVHIGGDGRGRGGGREQRYAQMTPYKSF